MNVSPTNIILSGTVGSTAYGLAGPDSDVDTLGIFVEPTQNFWGLSNPQESHVTTDPDVTLHEARKYVRLALAGNPTVIELMWLPDDLITACTVHGWLLRDIRSTFLSGPRVRAAYLGYATQQFQRLEKRLDGSFSSTLRKRTGKHARHMARLVYQGAELYRTGELRIRLEEHEAHEILAFGDRVEDGDLESARVLMLLAETAFNSIKTPLPDTPDEAPALGWLRTVRSDFL